MIFNINDRRTIRNESDDNMIYDYTIRQQNRFIHTIAYWNGYYFYNPDSISFTENYKSFSNKKFYNELELIRVRVAHKRIRLKLKNSRPHGTKRRELNLKMEDRRNMIKDTMVKLNNGVLNSSFMTNVKEYTKNLYLFKAKNNFGKEFYINVGENLKEDDKLYKFLSKFVPDFDTMLNDDRLVPTIKMTKLDRNTYMYIATKQYIPGKMTAAFTGENIVGDLYIYIFGKKSPKYIKALEVTLKKRFSDRLNTFIYTVSEIKQDTSNITGMFMEKRDVNSLLYSFSEEDKVVEHIESYLNGRDFYIQKQIPYKTGILLYGKPGTGKSSMVKALATKFNRSVVSIDMSNIDKIDFSNLAVMINNEYEEQYIVLFEDIDTLFLNREDEKNQDKNYNDIINKLLQFLDSNQSPKNVIFIATTNHIERLDDALIRDGRFDLKIEVKELMKKDISRFVKTFDLDESVTDQIVEEYVKDVGEEPELFNQSKLQNIILKKIKFDNIVSM